MLAEGTVPGLWLLLSGHSRENVPVEKSEDGNDLPRAVPCEAVALALVPQTEVSDGVQLSVVPEVARTLLSELTLSDLVDVLMGDEPIGRTWRMPGAGWIALEAVALSAGSSR